MNPLHALARKITGNPCIGCKKRISPEMLAAVEGMSYVPSAEYDIHEEARRAVVETCVEHFNDTEFSTANDRFGACADRSIDPRVALASAVAVKLNRKN